MDTTKTNRPALATGTYTIDPARTSVTFGVQEVFHQVTGTFACLGGRVVVADRLEDCAVEARIDAASFTTDKPRRDKDVRGKRFLDAATYPEITFTGTGVRAEGSGWVLSGVLGCHGTEEPVDLVVEALEPHDDGLHARATARVDRRTSGVGAGRGLIGRYVDITLDVVASH